MNKHGVQKELMIGRNFIRHSNMEYEITTGLEYPKKSAILENQTLIMICLETTHHTKKDKVSFLTRLRFDFVNERKQISI